MAKKKHSGSDESGTGTMEPGQENGTPKPIETKAEKFVRLAERRVPKAIKALLAIQNLANKVQYEATPEQAQKVIDTLQDSLNAIKQAFSGTRNVASTFTLR